MQKLEFTSSYANLSMSAPVARQSFCVSVNLKMN